MPGSIVCGMLWTLWMNRLSLAVCRAASSDPPLRVSVMLRAFGR
jgi:hypothetical protein